MKSSLYLCIVFFFSMDEEPQADELIVLLEFALARGSLGSILDVLKLLVSKLWLIPLTG